MSVTDTYIVLLLIFISTFHAANTSPDRPLWVSKSWLGYDEWANNQVNLEVRGVAVYPEAYWDWSQYVFLTYDYVLTDENGYRRRVPAKHYDTDWQTQTLENSTAVISFNTTGLNVTNQFSVVIYGNYIDPIQQALISLSLKEAYGVTNPDWGALKDAMLVMWQPEQLIGPNSEELTKCKFSLLDDKFNQLSELGVNKPADRDLIEALKRHGVFTHLYQSSVIFQLADGFGLNVEGIVLDKDVKKFQNVLTWSWGNSSSLSMYSSTMSLVVLLRAKYFTANGAIVTRLVYFLFSGDLTDTQSSPFSVLNRKQLGVSGPSSEEVWNHIKPDYFDAPGYNRLPTDSEELYPAKMSHALPLTERPLGNDTLDEIENELQEFFDQNKDLVDVNVTVKVITYEEMFSAQNRVAFTMVFWYVIEDGKIRDARFDVQLWSVTPTSIGVKLPSGKRLITANINSDNHVPRSSCYWLAIDSFVTDVTVVQQALVTAYSKKAELSSNKFNVSVQIFGNEEYVNDRGSATVLFYCIKLWYAKFNKYICASTSPELNLEASAIQLSGITFLERSDILENKYQRYDNLWGLLLQQKPISYLRGSLVNRVEQILSNKLSVTVKCDLTRIEEFKTLDWMTVWRFVFKVTKYSNGQELIVYPETIPQVNSTDLSFETPRGSKYTVVEIRDDTSPPGPKLLRVTDLHRFDLNLPLSPSDKKDVEKKLAVAYQSILVGRRSMGMVTANIVGTKEPVPCSECSLYYGIYVMMTRGPRLLSRNKFPPLNFDDASSLFGGFESPKKKKVPTATLR